MHFKFYRQLEEKDCGPTCLKMIAKHFGKEYEMEELREYCNLTRLGATLQDIKIAAENIGLSVLAIKVDVNMLKTLQLPIMLHWKNSHYVVLHRIEKKKEKYLFYIADPAFGKVSIGENILEKNWFYIDDKGFVLMFEPKESFFEREPFIKKKNQELRKLWNTYKIYLQEHRPKIIASIFLTIIVMTTSWTLPYLFQKIIDGGVIGKNMNLVWWIILLQFIIAISNFISNSISSVLLMRTNFKISVQLLTEYLSKVIRLPIKMFDTKVSSDFIVRMDDINRIQNFITTTGIDFFILAINLLVFSALLIYYNLSIFFIVFGLGTLGILWASFFLRKRRALDYALTSLHSENQLSVFEMITEMPEIKANNAEKNKIAQWKKIYKRQSETFLSTLYLNYWQVLGPTLFSRLENVFTTAICAYLVINNKMTIGTMMSIGFITAQLSAPMDKFIYFLRNLQDISLSNERVQEIQNREEENHNRNILVNKTIIDGIRLDNVTFKYPGSNSVPILNNINAFVPNGKVTAIVGMSGSGKTTLMKLLLGFYSPIQGNILIGDDNLSKVNLNSWRDRIGVVMQNGYIYGGTFIENIALADETPNIEQVKKAAELACLDDFIHNLPQKYKTKIGKSGIELSGGQKQRILIARAIYKNPEFLFLDEATSALDANTEKAIVENLSQFFKGKTVIVIAHRLSTVKNADQILVIQKGKIIESGNHKILASYKGEYFNLVKNQLELGN